MTRTDDNPNVLERTETQKKVRRPRRWRVLMHNDDFTTQEFVVHVLQKFFRKGPSDAAHIMMSVHVKGLASVGTYSKDVAETKTVEVIDYARANGHPLMLSTEPDEEADL